MPGEVYKELEFTDRAQVDRAVKLFEQAVDAERRGVKVTDLVPRYRNAAGEWRKVQVQGETAGTGNEPLLAYAVFMQGYAKQQARDRNEAIKLYNEVLDIYPEQKCMAQLSPRFMRGLILYFTPMPKGMLAVKTFLVPPLTLVAPMPPNT